MPDHADTARLSPDARRGEIAAVLANGVLRLHERAALPTAEQLENSGKPAQDGLAIPGETRLSVRVG